MEVELGGMQGETHLTVASVALLSDFVLTCSPKRHPASKSFPIPEAGGKRVLSSHHCILFTLPFALTHDRLHKHVAVILA